MSRAAEPPDDPAGEPFSHLDRRGRARMVDVSEKADTLREARARARLTLLPELRERLFGGDLPKGEAIGTARLAGIQAAKETSRLIPLCHPLQLTGIEVAIEPCGDRGVEIVAAVRCRGATGVEMEALTAVAVAALTLYDMCKALQRDITIGPIELLEKSGGQSGTWRRPRGSGGDA